MLRALNLNSASTDEIEQIAKVNHQLCEAVIANRPYADTEDVLGCGEIRSRASEEELLRLLIAHDLATEKQTGTSLSRGLDALAVSQLPFFVAPIEFEGVILQAREVERKNNTYYEYSISDKAGNEFVSAQFLSGKILDEATVRFLDLAAWDFARLSNIQTEKKLLEISTKECHTAANLFKQELPESLTDDQKTCFKMVSELLVNFIGFIRIGAGRQTLPGTQLTESRARARSIALDESPDPSDHPVNGCTSSPDFDFKSCCNQHDICYGIGGNEEDRKRCDLRLRDCIHVKGHPILAVIYYQGVRAAGWNFFNYDVQPVLPPTDPPIGLPVTIHLDQARYGGTDIGSDIRVNLEINGKKKFYNFTDSKFQYGTTKKLEDGLGEFTISETEPEVQLLAVVIEEDGFGFEDMGSATLTWQLSLAEMPDAGQKRTLTVKVPGRLWGEASFQFDFRATKV